MREVRCDDGEFPEHFGAYWHLNLGKPVSFLLANSEGGLHIGGQGGIMERLPFSTFSVRDIADAIALEIRDNLMKYGKVLGCLVGRDWPVTRVIETSHGPAQQCRIVRNLRRAVLRSAVGRHVRKLHEG